MRCCLSYILLTNMIYPQFLTNIGEFHSLETAIHIYEVFHAENLFNITYLCLHQLGATIGRGCFTC